MLSALIYIILGFVLVMLVVMTYQFHALKKNTIGEEHGERMSLSPPQSAGCVTATPLLLRLSKNMLRIF